MQSCIATCLDSATLHFTASSRVQHIQEIWQFVNTGLAAVGGVVHVHCDRTVLCVSPTISESINKNRAADSAGWLMERE